MSASNNQTKMLNAFAGQTSLVALTEDERKELGSTKKVGQATDFIATAMFTASGLISIAILPASGVFNGPVICSIISSFAAAHFIHQHIKQNIKSTDLILDTGMRPVEEIFCLEKADEARPSVNPRGGILASIAP